MTNLTKLIGEWFSFESKEYQALNIDEGFAGGTTETETSYGREHHEYGNYILDIAVDNKKGRFMVVGVRVIFPNKLRWELDEILNLNDLDVPEISVRSGDKVYTFYRQKVHGHKEPRYVLDHYRST